MIMSKNIEKICIAIIIAALLISLLVINAEKLGVEIFANTSYEDLLFDDSYVHSIEIVINQDDYDELLASPGDKEYYLADIIIDDKNINNAAIRTKGNSSLSSLINMPSERYSYKIEFDHYDDTINYFGLDKLSLNNIFQDSTYLKDYLAYDMMNYMGVDAPLASYTTVSINGEYVGFYLAVEAVEDSFIDRAEDYSNNGELYKPETEDRNMQNLGGDNDMQMPGMGDRQTGEQGNMPGMGERPTGEGRNMPGMGEMPTGEDDAMPQMGDDPNNEEGSMPQRGETTTDNESAMPQAGEPPTVEENTTPQAGEATTDETGGMPQRGEGTTDEEGAEMPQAGGTSTSEEGNMPEMGGMPMGETGNMLPTDMLPEGFLEYLEQNGKKLEDFEDNPEEMFELIMSYMEESGLEDELLNMPPMEGMPTEDDGSMPQIGDMAQGFGMDRMMNSNEGNLSYIDDNYESYSYIFDNAKTDISDNDRDQIIDMLKAITYNEDVEDYLDMDNIITYWAVHNYLLNYDSYTGTMMHNYYLYEENGVVSIIPWDYNLSFGTFILSNGQSATSYVNYPIDSPTISDISERPLINVVLSNDEYLELYHDSLETLIAEYFDSGYFKDKINSTIEMIEPYVKADTTSFFGYDSFVQGSQSLVEFCLLRAESIGLQLEGIIPSTNEGQQNFVDFVNADHIDMADLGDRGGR